jgi:hypothetical protein
VRHSEEEVKNIERGLLIVAEKERHVSINEQLLLYFGFSERLVEYICRKKKKYVPVDKGYWVLDEAMRLHLPPRSWIWLRHCDFSIPPLSPNHLLPFSKWRNFSSCSGSNSFFAL